jgi:hypothetical protein
MATPIKKLTGLPQRQITITSKRILLLLTYLSFCAFAFKYIYANDSLIPVFNIIASWGTLLPNIIEVDGYGGVILIMFAYVIVLFFCTSLFARSRLLVSLHLPVLQLTFHWAGVLIAFLINGNIPMPSVSRLLSFTGISELSVIFLLPAMATSFYLILDWRIAATK